jgi:hypothetical protein
LGKLKAAALRAGDKPPLTVVIAQYAGGVGGKKQAPWVLVVLPDLRAEVGTGLLVNLSRNLTDEGIVQLGL